MKKKLFIALLGCSISVFHSYAGKNQEILWDKAEEYLIFKTTNPCPDNLKEEEEDTQFFIDYYKEYYEKKRDNAENFSRLIYNDVLKISPLEKKELLGCLNNKSEKCNVRFLIISDGIEMFKGWRRPIPKVRTLPHALEKLNKYRGVFEKCYRGRSYQESRTA